jgi:hypothetical protein
MQCSRIATSISRGSKVPPLSRFRVQEQRFPQLLVADVLPVSEYIFGDQKVACFAVQRERTTMSIFEMVRSITLDSLGIAISQLLADVSTVSEDMLTRDQQVT